MDMEQKQYKEMFEEIRLSEDKKMAIEKAMMENGKVRRRFSVKKLVIMTACMIAVVSCVCIAGPQIAKSAKETLEEKGDVITDESRGERVPNKITADTKEIVVLVDGELEVWEIDVTPFVGENGNVDLGDLFNYISDDYMESDVQKREETGKYTGGMRMAADIDEEASMISIEVWTAEEPINEFAWGYKMYKGRWYLVVPENIRFIDEVAIFDCGDGARGIRLPSGFVGDDMLLFDFKYKGEVYTVAALGDHSVEIMKKK